MRFWPANRPSASWNGTSICANMDSIRAVWPERGCVGGGEASKSRPEAGGTRGPWTFSPVFLPYQRESRDERYLTVYLWACGKIAKRFLAGRAEEEEKEVGHAVDEEGFAWKRKRRRPSRTKRAQGFRALCVAASGRVKQACPSPRCAEKCLPNPSGSRVQKLA